MDNSSDIVAELDRWLASDPSAYGWHLMRRARDEIVALRDSNEQWNRLCGTIAAEKMSARASALEEAASVCAEIAEPQLPDTRRQNEYRCGAWACATAIRALKDKL